MSTATSLILTAVVLVVVVGVMVFIAKRNNAKEVAKPVAPKPAEAQDEPTVSHPVRDTAVAGGAAGVAGASIVEVPEAEVSEFDPGYTGEGAGVDTDDYSTPAPATTDGTDPSASWPSGTPWDEPTQDPAPLQDPSVPDTNPSWTPDPIAPPASPDPAPYTPPAPDPTPAPSYSPPADSGGGGFSGGGDSGSSSF